VENLWEVERRAKSLAARREFPTFNVRTTPVVWRRNLHNADGQVYKYVYFLLDLRNSESGTSGESGRA
jgi:hypothetical protein